MVCQTGMTSIVRLFPTFHANALKVTNFLNKMAQEIDLGIPGVVEHPERLPGHIASHPNPSKDPDLAPKPDFNPMRRKLAMKHVQ